jgi:hypothetical protein
VNQLAEGSTAMEAICKDCGFDTTEEYYALRNEIWEAAKGGEGQLCIGCVERRLDRRLDHHDFVDAPINAVAYLTFQGRPFFRVSERLRERLRGHKPSWEAVDELLNGGDE